VVAGCALTVSVFGRIVVGSFPGGNRFSLLPLVALVLVPTFTPRPVGGAELFARRTLAALAVAQTLHAYPVPGRQVAWGLLLAAVCGVVTVSDGVSDIVGAEVLASGSGPKVAVAIGAAAVIAIPLLLPFGLAQAQSPGEQLRRWVQQYRSGSSVSIPGTGPLRLERWDAETIRTLARALPRSCDTFVSFPAWLDRFHVVADVPPPTGLNPADHRLLTRGEEVRVVDALHRDRGRVCLLLGPDAATLRATKGAPSARAVDVTGEDGTRVRDVEAARWEVVTRIHRHVLLRRLDE
jgi:hypothetical protein